MIDIRMSIRSKPVMVSVILDVAVQKMLKTMLSDRNPQLPSRLSMWARPPDAQQPENWNTDGNV